MRVIAETASWVIVSGQVFVFFGILVTAIYSYKAHANTKEVNDAVNHRRKTPTYDPMTGEYLEPQPRLFDMVYDMHTEIKELKDWRAQWAAMPENMDSAVKLVERFGVIEGKIDGVKETTIASLHEVVEHGEAIHTDMAERISHVEVAVADVKQQISNHVKWEMETKYVTGEVPVVDAALTITDTRKEP